MEKESLDVMKQQLAAVHQLRIDLQRKDSVIQARQGGGLRKRTERGGGGCSVRAVARLFVAVFLCCRLSPTLLWILLSVLVLRFLWSFSSWLLAW